MRYHQQAKLEHLSNYSTEKLTLSLNMRTKFDIAVLFLLENKVFHHQNTFKD